MAVGWARRSSQASSTPGTPRLTRVVNHFAPQALAGVVEDLDLTYDLVDGTYNPSNVTTLPYHDAVNNVDYNEIGRAHV